MRRQGEVILQHEAIGCYRIVGADGPGPSKFGCRSGTKARDFWFHEVVTEFGDLVHCGKSLRELLLARGGATIQAPEESCQVNPRLFRD